MRTKDYKKTFNFTYPIQIQLNKCIQNTWIHNEINDANSFFKLSRKIPYIFST
jgi:hypothetical protein